MNPDCDVLVVGGGLVGLTLACALSRQSLRIRVLEAGSEFQAPEKPGLRVSAINPASRKLLSDLGAWELVDESSLSAFSRMRVWDEAVAPFGDRSLEFAGADFGVAPLGHIVHNDPLQWALYQRASDDPLIDVVFNARVEELAVEAGGVRVFGNDQSQHTAKLLVGADGMRSGVRTLSNINVVHKSYAQQGIVCNVQTDRPHEATAWQRFLSTGPLALLPLASGECSIVWSLDDEKATRLKAYDDEQFSKALTEASDEVLGPISVTSKRAAFPLGLLRAERYVSNRVVLVGDAAHVVHPLAGQGVNLGFGDAARLSAVLADGIKRGDEIGDRLALRKYERARKYENHKMQMTIDGLHRVFSQSHTWLQEGRSLGMGLLNLSPTIKGNLAKEALGTKV